MSVGLFRRYVDELDGLLAEQQRAASLAAAYPHMTRQGARDYWRSLTQAVQATARQADRATLFSWNGAPVSIKGLRQKLGEVIGGGLAA